MQERWVMVTTKWRGVFFGRLAEETDRVVDLEDVRMAIHWGTTGGILELAQKGPGPKSKLGDMAPRCRLHGVTAIIDCTPEARDKWRGI